MNVRRTYPWPWGSATRMQTSAVNVPALGIIPVVALFLDMHRRFHAGVTYGRQQTNDTNTITMLRQRIGGPGFNACVQRPVRDVSVLLVAGLALCLSGCNGAPSLTIAGAYFPAWLLCAVIAVLVAIVVRTIMVASGLSNRVPFQLAVCFSIGIIVALILWQVWVVR